MKLQPGNSPFEILRNTVEAEALKAFKVDGWRNLVVDQVMPTRQKEVVLADNGGVTWVDWTPGEVLDGFKNMRSGERSR